MRFKLIINLLLLLVAVQGFGQSKSVYEKSVDLFNQNGQQEKIIPYLQTELKKQPKNENLLALIAFQYLQSKNTELGERYYMEAIVVNPACVSCYLNISRIYAQKNEFQKALNYLDKAILANPKDDLLLTSRAQIKEAIGDTFGALSDYNKAISIAPKNADNYIQRGIYNLSNKYNSLALVDLNEAISLRPNSYDAYFYRSRIKFENNDLQDALKDIDKAILLDAKQNRFYNFRGTIYKELKQSKNALENYSKAIKLSSEDFYSYLSRAQVYYDLENMDSACDDYASAKVLIEKQKNNNPEFLKNIENAMVDICDQSKSSYFFQRGVAFYNLKQYENALAIYDVGLKKFPKNPMILSFKGNAYLAMKDYPNALANYENALANIALLMAEIKKNHRFDQENNEGTQTFYDGFLASIYYNVAECGIYAQKYDDALNAMNQALAIAPNVTDFNKEKYYARRGNIYLEKKNYDFALTDFNKSIQINKNYAPSYVGRAIAKVSQVENAKKSNAIISAKLPNQPFRINWEIKSKSSSFYKTNPNIKSGLEDCNQAIVLDQNNGFAYLIRGQIKSFLGQSDYRIDLIKAKELGIEVDID
ncbi:tetratricopeptide repeat protein [Pedobacter jamesrossensis]|uniref:Tetratricopeptide repeat protein n=1 Tax=Pedobacter jamesrossensis TaxID=1908238 RepID=A0ABV8NM61_9SPHI